jgi:hypothetical protein
MKLNLETKAAFRRRSIGTYSEHIMMIGFGVARKIRDVARRLHDCCSSPGLNSLVFNAFEQFKTNPSSFYLDPVGLSPSSYRCGG